MKKALVFLFSALLLLGLFVSCDNSVNTNKGLVTIKLGAAVGKDLTTSTDYVPFDTLDWYYMASTESEEFNFGETANFTKLNNLGESIELSQGIWDFKLIAVPAGTATLVESAVMYAGDVENVLVTIQADGDSLTIDIPVFANMAGFGYISFGDIKIVLRDGSNAAVAPNCIVFDGEVEHGTLPEEKVAVPTGTYSIKLCYEDPNDGILKAEETVEVTVYSGATTTISGIISEVSQDVVLDCVYLIPSYEALIETIRLVDEARIILTDDIEVRDTIVIPAGKKIEIDLNGYTMCQEKACTAGYSMIENKGTLTIKDTRGDGKISFKDTGAGDPNFGWGSYTIHNSGDLIVESGTIEMIGNQNVKGEPSKHCLLAIFQYSGTTEINGGSIVCENYRSFRLWNGSVEINGGNFVGQIWVQKANANVNGELTVTGGTFNPSKDDSCIYIEAGKNSISGGNFNGYIKSDNPTSEGIKGSITGGTFTCDAYYGTDLVLFAENNEVIILAE